MYYKYSTIILYYIILIICIQIFVPYSIIIILIYFINLNEYDNLFDFLYLRSLFLYIYILIN